MFKTVGIVLGRLLLFAFLTLLTQTGGIVYLLHLLLFRRVKPLLPAGIWRPVAGFAIFLMLYLLTSFFVVPPLARAYGRVPLPWRSTPQLHPLRSFTCLLNRHYVRPALRDAVLSVAKDMEEKYPGTVVNYLDAGFPFFDKFPLLPHLSHHDGRKLDLAFCYNDARTGRESTDAPSPIGYGICEGPMPGESDAPDDCAQKGFWQYNVLQKIIPQGAGKNFRVNAAKTAWLVQCCAAHPDIRKIFIEPHLKTRWALDSPKIRFHGCQAVRHDDHIHIQL